MRAAAARAARAARAATAVTLLLALAACGGKHAAAPRPAAPALFAAIPADTPYVLASFEPLPLDWLARYRDTVGATLRRSLLTPDAEDAPDAADVYSRIMAAIFAELDGKWTAAGMESLGFSATPRFAIYGLGLYPVARLEIRDGTLLLATIERIARRGQLQLPQPETQGSRKLWRVVEGEHALVIAIAPDEVVLAYTPAAELEAALPLVLGTRRPARNMADGAVLAAARAKYRLGGHALGLIDTRQLATRLLTRGQPAPACAAEIERLAARVPRLVGGYAIGFAAVEGNMVIELAPDLVRELRALRVELPALPELAAGKPLLMLAGGIDLPRAQALAVAGAAAIGRTLAACGAPDEPAAAAARELGRPLPEPLAQLRGGVLWIQSLTIPPGPFPLPTELDGFVLASSPRAAALFGSLREAVAAILPLDFGADGKLHEIPPDRLPLALAFPLFAGAGERAIVIAAGAGDRRAERAMAARRAPAPLLVLDADYGQLAELVGRFDDEKRELDAAQARFYGRTRASLDITEHGLEARTVFETKPRPR